MVITILVDCLSYTTAVDYHNEWGEIGGVAMVGEEYNLTEHWKNSTEENESTPPSGGNSTYPNPLGLEWQIREWLGLALLLITILTAGTLAFVAQKVILNKEHQQQLAHDRGCFLTEQGVAELLQVGWRYHHHHGGGGDDGQLFLQVFDKGVPSPSEDDYNHGEDNEDPDNHRQFPPQRILIGHQSNTPCHYNQRQ